VLLPLPEQDYAHHVTLIETEYGSHRSFLAESDGNDGRRAEQQVVSFLPVLIQAPL
jgi:predicted alpha/beta-fold hydrolase